MIEEHDGVCIPIEYKHGRQGIWLNDAIQLCAQALCLEERLADQLSEARSSVDTVDKKERSPGAALIPYGYIYYAGSRRRVRVNFTGDLRNRTHSAIVQALLIAAQEQVPPPLDASLARRCPNCSLRPLCLPDEVKQLQSRKKGA